MAGHYPAANAAASSVHGGTTAANARAAARPNLRPAPPTAAPVHRPVPPMKPPQPHHVAMYTQQYPQQHHPQQPLNQQQQQQQQQQQPIQHMRQHPQQIYHPQSQQSRYMTPGNAAAPPPAQPASRQPLQPPPPMGGVSTAAVAPQPRSMRPVRPNYPLPPSQPSAYQPAPPTQQIAAMSVSNAPYPLQSYVAAHPQPAVAGGYAQQQVVHAPPPGMGAITVADARGLPRPDGASERLRARLAHPPSPPVMTTVPPQACPVDMFRPCSTQAVRLCTTLFPAGNVMSRKFALPLGAVVTPLADRSVPVVNFGGKSIVRCRRCRSYINFSCSFVDGGRRWICTLCRFSNDVPNEYFAPLDHHGRRCDASKRPELHCGTVEFVAPQEYMVRPPIPPVYLFLFETTPMAVRSGVLQAAVTAVLNSIASLPNRARTKVALLTFDSIINFYTLQPGPDAEPVVYALPDINDVFLPTPDRIVVPLDECRPCFETALNMIAKSAHASERVSSPSCLGAALTGAQKVLEHTGGKIVVVAASRPTIGPGELKDRADVSLLGSDRERSVLRPSSGVYRHMAQEMSKYQTSCDLFLCPPGNHFLDLASLSPLFKDTGGELFYAPAFEAPLDAPRLQLAINRCLVRETGLEAVMRIRATKSVRCTQFSGRFFRRSTDLLAMPNVDADKSYALRFAFDEASVGEGPFCVQVALLYTTTTEERRIRVHTLVVPTTNQLTDLYASVDVYAVTNLFARTAAEGMKDRALKEIQKTTEDKVVAALAKYREVCITQYPSAGSSPQLLVPDAMTLLPLLIHGLNKSPLLSRDTAGAFLQRFDDKSAYSHRIDVMSVGETAAMLYSNVIPVYPWPADVKDKAMVLPSAATATVASLRQDLGVLIDDGSSLILWLGSAILMRFTAELLGRTVDAPVDPRLLALELLRNGASAKGDVANVYRAVTAVMRNRPPSIPFYVVPAGDQRMQPRVEALMTEDRSASTVNYREFLLGLQSRVAQSTGKK